MGYKPTGRPPGRPKGGKTTAPVKRPPRATPVAKSERELIENIDPRVAEAIAAARPAGVEPFKGGAVEFLMSLYKDPLQPLPVRLDAAKAAAKYETPALQSVIVTRKSAYDDIEDADELRRALQAEAVAAGIAPPPDARGARGARGKPNQVRH